MFETPPEGYLLSETFEDAKALLRAADRFGLEGIVSKRKEMGYILPVRHEFPLDQGQDPRMA